MFAVQPILKREAIRAFDVTSLVTGEQADYSVGQHTVEVPLYQAVLVGGKALTKAKPGDELVLTPKVKLVVKNRIVQLQVHELLYKHGLPSYRHLYKHGDTIDGQIRWECIEPLDLKVLPYLFDVYIVDQHVR